MEEIARPLGVRLPVWLEGTLNDATITRSLAYEGTFTVPDTTTGWSDIVDRVQQALDAAVPEKFPAGWAVLAVDAMQRLTAIRAAHEQVADSGPGWYLVARPARPQVSIVLEGRLVAAEPCPDLTQVVAELDALRHLEADADRDDPLGDLYAELMQLLHYQLRHHIEQGPDDGTGRTNRITSKNSAGEHPDPTLVAAYEDTLVRYSSTWSGAAIDVWASTLQPVDDPAAALRLRRVQRLLNPGADNLDPTDVQIYRGPAGRYVMVHPPRQDQPWFAAEWPTSRAAVAGWTDKTMLVADNNANTTTLLALTPTPDGQMRVDPVPMPMNPAREAFAFGYGGGTPSTTHLAILRCALDPVDFDALAGGKLWRTIANPATGPDEPVSQLWTEISTSRGGPLRLSWSQVQRWARDTVRTVRDHPASTS